MMTLQSRTGDRFELASLDETDAATLAPALAPGWLLGTVKPVPTFQPIGGAPPPVEAKKERKPRAVKQPVVVVLKAVEDLFLPGYGATKGTAREKLQQFTAGEVDGAIDWLTAHGALTLTGKTYRAKVPVSAGGAT